MDTSAILAADERRAARDSFRATGGSKRRPLKSFLTAAEKKERREAHASRIHAAVGELVELGGFRAWAESLDLNPQLSPLNAALVALQTPGEIVASATGWHQLGYRVRKGERAAGFITAPGFWPLAYFTAPQANAGNLQGIIPVVPDDDALDGLRVRLVAALERGEKRGEALAAIAEGIAACEREGDALQLAC